MADHEKPAWWAPIVHFATHTAVGAAIFLVIAIPVVILHLLVHVLEAFGIAGYISGVLTALEYTLLTLDAVSLVVYLLITLWKAIKEWAR